jgi:hypothetical protein
MKYHLEKKVIGMPMLVPEHYGIWFVQQKKAEEEAKLSKTEASSEKMKVRWIETTDISVL